MTRVHGRRIAVPTSHIQANEGEALKLISQDPSRIPGIAGRAIRWRIRSLCLVATLLAGALMTTPAVGAGNADNGGPVRVLRLPDTWEVTATDNSIYFAEGSSAIEEDDAEMLRRHAARLRAMPELQITLIAHTADLGSSSLELARGQERLEAVRKRLEDLKVPPNRIRKVNHGNERPSAQACSDDDCLRRNRRVDIVVHR